MAEPNSAPTIPLIADGFSTQVGRYSADPGQLGGVWRGRSAIVVFCDRSAQIVKLDQQMRFTNPKQNGRDEFVRAGVDMLNPSRPPR